MHNLALYGLKFVIPTRRNYKMNQKLLLQYLRRIKFQGTPDVSLKTLSQIILRHTQTFAFENLNPLVGLPVSLELETIAHKFIVEHRGGYCFEHNRLLLEVFKAIGFDVRGLLGKVYAKGKRIEDLQRTHMIVLVSLDGKNFIADVGFGGFDPTSPIRLVCNRIQKTTKENFDHLCELHDTNYKIYNKTRTKVFYANDKVYTNIRGIQIESLEEAKFINPDALNSLQFEKPKENEPEFDKNELQ